MFNTFAIGVELRISAVDTLLAGALAFGFDTILFLAL